MAMTRDRFEESVQAAAALEIKRIVIEETNKAVAEVERRINEAADRLALHVLENYSVEDLRNEIVIHVKKAAKGIEA